nr:MAG TPA: hypothetical protein [Caudoviricetes sp.]
MALGLFLCPFLGLNRPRAALFLATLLLYAFSRR